MTIENRESIEKQNPFLDSPVFMDWYGSYYHEPLEYEWEKYVIYKKPHKLFYPGIYFVRVIKLIPWLPYGSNEREYSSMVFKDWKILPLPYGISINNWEELNEKHPIIDTETNWYMKYNENWECTPLKGLPEGFHPSNRKGDNYENNTIELYNNDTSQRTVYYIDKEYNLRPIEWTLEWMDIYEIKNNIASVDPKNGEFDKFYLYNPTKGKIEPFIFKGFEGKTYEIEAYNTDRNVISIIDEDWNTHYFYFDGKAEINEEIIFNNVEAKLVELNKNSETARVYNIQGEHNNNTRNQEWFFFFKNGEIKPFSWLKEGEFIAYDETYQFINPKSLVKSLVIQSPWKYHPEYECRTFDENWIIKPFEGLQEWRRVESSIARLREDNHFQFISIKIKWFWEGVNSLLSKDFQRIIRYKGMLIWWISLKDKTINIITKAGPDCDIELNDEEWLNLMKERDPNYTPKENDITWETNKNIVQSLIND